ncbi:MAG TPA: beta-L-arabinofuranosidase domain-containing protein [Acidobacteriaceae bacterium]
MLLASDLHETQLHQTHAVLMALSEDSLLKPFRQMSGMTAPGENLGGWYDYDADYDYRKPSGEGFAPGCTFGQWVSALARGYAITGNKATQEKVIRLNQMFAEAVTADVFVKNRFPAYTYDKVLLGLIDSHTLVGDPNALAILERVTDIAEPHLPGHAIEHGARWRMDHDDPSWTWDESYTMPENLFLAYQRGAGRRYFDLGKQYLDDGPWFDPLSRNENVLAGRHAYSHVNSLNSAAAAYLVAGSEKHLRAARNGLAMVEAQSFATGGWGPDELLRAPGSDDLYTSLTKTHASFETPCGSYAHFKLTRYLLRVTREAHYGDSMERVMYNTVLGAKPLEENGRTFYYSDYNSDGERVYHRDRWPCCSGTLPQVAADYRINTYFRGVRAVYVNLYVPSTLRWTEDGVSLSLAQEGNYPFEENVTLTVTSSRPEEQTLYFRIPAWAQGASLLLNGVRQKDLAAPGQFAAVRRMWKSGDRVELELPLKMRLEAIDERHPETVALVRGPIVLMAVKSEQGSSLPSVTRQQILGAQRLSERQWQMDTAGGPVRMLPFISMGDLPYTTYLKTV